MNYGRPEDYVAIEKLGIDMKGKIVLARYGGLFRGLKVRNAQKRGAAGILIFSDPADDGFAKGDVYPSGRFRPGSAIQRGSVQFLSLGPGDPSTPFGPSVKGAKRLPFDVNDGFGMTEIDLFHRPFLTKRCRRHQISDRERNGKRRLVSSEPTILRRSLASPLATTQPTRS